MPAPIDPDKRAAIIDAINAGTGRNQIARDHNVALGTVTKIAQDEGLADAFDRSALKDATEAAKADLAERKTRLARLLMDRAFQLNARIDEQQDVVVITKEGAEVVQVDTTAKDVRDFLVAIGIAVDKVGVLTRDDSQGLAAVDSWLHSLGVGATQG